MFLWFSYGFPMVFLWFSYGFPMVFLWFSYGFPMVFLFSSPTEPSTDWAKKKGLVQLVTDCGEPPLTLPPSPPGPALRNSTGRNSTC